MMLNLQKIVIVPDKFKGSLTSLEVAKSIQLGIIKGNPNLSIDFSIIPIADGGDGSMDVIEQYLDNNNISYTIYNSKVHNPLGKIIDAPIVIYNKIAFIEMAKVSGITLLEDNEKNPLKTSTYGLGELIKEAKIGRAHV